MPYTETEVLQWLMAQDNIAELEVVQTRTSWENEPIRFGYNLQFRVRRVVSGRTASGSWFEFDPTVAACAIESDWVWPFYPSGQDMCTLPHRAVYQLSNGAWFDLIRRDEKLGCWIKFIRSHESERITSQ